VDTISLSGIVWLLHADSLPLILDNRLGRLSWHQQVFCDGDDDAPTVLPDLSFTDNQVIIMINTCLEQ
jgi:hypothetical protein